MMPSHRARYGCDATRNSKWRMAAAPAPLLKRPAGAPQPWPVHPHPTGHVHRSHLPPPPPLPPHLPLFHTRHAEESAERPHLVTIIRPCSESTLRKVTVLLNRRGVVSFDQLLLDISEALGFPRWHRARVTRLYTTHAREVKGVCDFFRGEVAFLALGKARPELGDVQEALEELFPEHSHYRAAALRAWEKRLRPAPDKAAKADSGYSEGMDSSEKHQDVNTQPPHYIDTKPPENYNLDVQKFHKKNSYRKPAHLPNHLQRLRARDVVRERQDSLIGPFKREEVVREADVLSPTLCENCLARGVKPQGPEWHNPLSGRAPLPPVSRKQKGSLYIEEEGRKHSVPISPPPPPPISREEEKSVARLPPKPLPDHTHKDIQQRMTSDLPSDGSTVTLADVERHYEIGHVVGDGNFAVVRECRRRHDGQTLAVKIVEHSKLIGREHMMQNELSLLGSLCHPRIVKLFAHHHTHSHSYLVMELVSGGDLFEAISERGKFPEAEAGLMVSDVSEALNYIHCKSIVHRDLKPENLLIEHVAAGICRVKLGDFGLAMVVTEPVYTICGTPTYVAPEILCETGYGVAVDIWALGVILYILLCGFPPFRSRDRDQEELFRLIKQGQLHFLSPYWDPISEEARVLVRALLQPDPTVRLTAEQTVTHPWVKAMPSICRQRALTDKAQGNAVDVGAEPDKSRQVQRPAETNAEPEDTPGPTSSKGKVTNSDENKAQEQQPTETRTVDTIIPQPQVCVASEAKPGQQVSPSTEPSRPEIQDQGPPDSDPVSPAGLKLNQQLSDPKTKQKSLQPSPPPSTYMAQQTTAGDPTRHLSTEPAPAPPSRAANAQNHDEPHVHTAQIHYQSPV